MAHRLSVARIDDAPRLIDPVFLDSPQLVSEPLSGLLGCTLTVKVETINPIRSFKGRGASLFAAGVADEPRATLVCASAGNFGQGLAHACRRRGLALVVYAARNANPLKLARMRALGAEVRLSGDDFDAAKDAAERWAAETGARLVVDGLEPAISEGAGTIARELLGRGAAYDAVVVPVGNGALIGGIACWFKARSPATRVIGVCSRGAPVMAEAFLATRAERPAHGAATASSPAPDTIADGIAVRVAVPEAVADMAALVDDVVLVDDAALIEAMRLIHQHVGLVVEPAGAAGVAALLAIAAPGSGAGSAAATDRDPALARLAGASVATVLCGGNLTAAQIHHWLGPLDRA